MSNLQKAEEFFSRWDQGETEFIIHSSGSTGAPRPIVLQRRWMEWSALKTGEAMHVLKGDSILCCLPVDKVGGLMMLVRSRVWNIPVIVTEPVSNPLKNIDTSATIVSLTPQQIYEVMQDEQSRKVLSKFREVLIGGGSIPATIESALKEFPEETHIRHSYGMSETYSHIALRRLNGKHPEKMFKAFSEVEIKKSEDGTAVIFTPFYTEGIETNDVIELDDDGRFELIGRSDFMINSGGVKLQAELIEKLINETLRPESRFLIASVPDEKYGEMLVLVCENKKEFETAELNFLKSYNSYAIPKRIIEISELPYNSGGKPDRLKLRDLLSK